MKGIMTLHSTMYLFLRRASLSCICLLSLYIPQCIYFYFLRICYFCNNASLHSTMYLFLRGCNEKKKLPLDFTFHNVSISTKARANGCTTRNPTLHSTMYLFLRFHHQTKETVQMPLHSTMYLFLQEPPADCTGTIQPFTFHNVSISTERSSA